MYNKSLDPASTLLSISLAKILMQILKDIPTKIFTYSITYKKGKLEVT